MKKSPTSQTTELSEDTKSIITVLLLLFFFPVGFILMIFWVRWPTWVKMIIALPLFIVMFAIGWLFFNAILDLDKIGQKEFNPHNSSDRCKVQCQILKGEDYSNCYTNCKESSVKSATERNE